MTARITGRVMNCRTASGAAELRVTAWGRPNMLALQSEVGAGMHQHFFTGATAALTIDPEDVLIAPLYLTPSDFPSEVMLQWTMPPVNTAHTREQTRLTGK